MKNKLTEQEKENHIKSGFDECPYCQGLFPQKINQFYLSNTFNVELECNQCQKSWTEIYVLVNLVDPSNET